MCPAVSLNDSRFGAVIFDLDGTVIDTESLALTAGLAAFASLGVPVAPSFLHRLVGTDLPTAARIILAGHPGIDLETLNLRWRAGFEASVASHMPLKPGVLTLLAQLTLPRAICTSTVRAGAHHKLRLAGLGTAFAHVITLDDVRAPKPDPEPYLLTAARLGVPPARCVVFEDSDVGAEAAHRAGCCVVQVPDLLPTEGRFAHHVAADLLTGARTVGLIA